MRRARLVLGVLLVLAAPLAPGRAVLAASVEMELQARLAAAHPATAADARHLPVAMRFYEARDFRPLWTGPEGLTDSARTLVLVLESSEADGLQPEDYGANRIATLMTAGPDAAADLELELTLGLLAYAHDLHSGRMEPSRLDPELFVQPDALPPDEILAGAAAAGTEIAAFLKTFAPNRPEYQRLIGALSRYRRIADEGGWGTVPDGPSLKPGMADPRLAALAQRLSVTGDLRPEDGLPDMTHYGGALETAVLRFQARHGLPEDGVVGAGTVAALNVPVQDRVRQIVLNLERRRWLPRDLGDRYLFVNIADFTMRVVEGEAVLAKARLVVGAPSTRTPVFSASMTYVEINPTWNVPSKIALREILPKVRRDPSYLARHGYTLRSGRGADAVRVDPSTVDWQNVEPGRFPYSVRQVPGGGNSLGRIKYMFPNPFDVYLHDTPEKALFARTTRAYSHGCMRVQNALDLAPMIFALAGNADWTAERVAEAVATGRRTVVTLKQPLAVHVVYSTAFVARDGELQFRPDVYGRDARLAAAFFEQPARAVTISGP